jgi:uncharacterized membrane protein
VCALALLGASLTASVALVIELVYGTAPALVAGAVLATLVLAVWFGLPLVRRAAHRAAEG